MPMLTTEVYSCTSGGNSILGSLNNAKPPCCWASPVSTWFSIESQWSMANTHSSERLRKKPDMCGGTPSSKLRYLLVYNPSKTLMKMEFCSSTYRCKFNTKKNLVHVDSKDESILNYIRGFSLINHPAIGYFMEPPSALRQGTRDPPAPRATRRQRSLNLQQ